MALEKIKIRSYNKQTDIARLEELERSCEVGPGDRFFLFADTLGDPICRIRNSPLYKMLVAELDTHLVGVIQGSIKRVTVCCKPLKDQAEVGYILGLRVSPPHRRKGLGSSLVRRMEEWFIANHVDLAYMATEKDNEASVKLFTDKLGFVRFRTPEILVNSVGHRPMRVSRNVQVAKLKIEQAECLYKRFMSSSTDFFPHDMDQILRNKLSLGTWVAYPRGESWCDQFDSCRVPTSWAMLSVWNSGDIFKLRVEKAPVSCLIQSKSSRLIDRALPCLRVATIPDLFHPFGFYFMYGVHGEGPRSGELVRSLCHFVHNMARKCKDCKIIVTEIGGGDALRLHIPRRKLLSCPEDLWCIKALKIEEKQTLHELLTNAQATASLFVDPREV